MPISKKKQAWLPLREAIAFCKDNGKEITSVGIRSIAHKQGWGRKIGDHWYFGLKGLKQYVSLLKPEPGWIPVKSLSKILGKSLSNTYYVMYSAGLKTKRFGGILHVREESAKRLVNKYKGNNNE